MAIPRSPKPRNAYVDRTTGAKRRAAAETREQIAADLKRNAEQLSRDAEEYADERSPLLEAQADALWDAAYNVLAGIDRRGQDDLDWARSYHLRRLGADLRVLVMTRARGAALAEAER